MITLCLITGKQSDALKVRNIIASRGPMFFKNINIMRNNERLGAMLDKRRPKRRDTTKCLILDRILHQGKKKKKKKSAMEDITGAVEES